MNRIAKISIFFFFFSVIFFLFGSLTKLHLPLAEWDYVSLEAAESWAKGINKPWMFVHPPLYPFFLSILFTVLGAGVMTARLGNILCVLLTALLLLHFTSRLLNRDIAIWTTAVYLLSPVTIQGTASLDMADTSILPLAFLMTANAIRNNTLHPGPKNTAIVSGFAALSLWAKVTSTIALIIPFLLGCALYFLRGIRNKAYKPWLFNIVGITFGVTFFLFTWVILSQLLWDGGAPSAVLGTPWSAIHSRLTQASHFPHSLSQAYDVFRIGVWLSPYFVIMCALGSWHLAQHNLTSNDADRKFIYLFLWTTIFYFIGHLVLGGTNWSFPRYQAAILPFASVFAGCYISRIIATLKEREFYRFLLGVVIVLVCVISLGKDPLLFVNLGVKEMLLYDTSIYTVLREALITLLPYYGIPIIVWLGLRKLRHADSSSMRVSACLYLGALATIASMDIQHAFALYRTSNQYGAEEKIRVVQVVREHVKGGDYVVASGEFIYELRDEEISGSTWSVWQSKEELYHAITSNHPEAIIAGLTVNTYEQLKWLLGEDVQGYLGESYQGNRIGSYYVWLRDGEGQKNRIRSGKANMP
jgi:4-amino-4-deoxy-L-arabinose transferase-like glycosyltransferase